MRGFRDTHCLQLCSTLVLVRDILLVLAGHRLDDAIVGCSIDLRDGQQLGVVRCLQKVESGFDEILKPALSISETASFRYLGNDRISVGEKSDVEKADDCIYEERDGEQKIGGGDSSKRRDHLFVARPGSSGSSRGT